MVFAFVQEFKLKKSLLSGAFSASGLFFVAITANNAMAQGGASGLVYVPGPFECAQACTADLLCASWSFTPLNKNSGQSVGQCKLSNSPNMTQMPGTVSGLPQRAAPQNQVYYSNQIVPMAPAQPVNNYAQSQVPDWQPIAPKVQPNANMSSAYAGNYAIKPLNQPMQAPPVLVQNPPAVPMAAPIAPAAPSVVYAPKIPTPPPPQIVQAAPPIVQPVKPILAPPVVPAPMAAYQPPVNSMAMKPPIMAQTPPPAPVETVKSSNGPLRAGAAKPVEIVNKQDQKYEVASAPVPQYMPAQSYQTYKSAGSPQYSVQNEWNNVAEAVASGKNTTNIDWAKTKPVATYEDKAVPKEEAPKKSWFQNLFNKKEEVAKPEEVANTGFGPLRKN